MNKDVKTFELLTSYFRTSSTSRACNFILPMIGEYLLGDNSIRSYFLELESMYPKRIVDAKELAMDGKINFQSLARYELSITNWKEWVTFCYGYLISLKRNWGYKAINFFLGSNEPKQELFYNECLSPILGYISERVSLRNNAIQALLRYQVLCEWYDRDQITQSLNKPPNKKEKSISELSLTSEHLPKHLFNSGFDFCFTETNVPSGRIDTLGFDSDNNRTLKMIAIEGKIFRGKTSVVEEVINQVIRRVIDLQISEGYVVIYNTTKDNIILEGSSLKMQRCDVKKYQNATIYIFIVELNKKKSGEKGKDVSFNLNFRK